MKYANKLMVVPYVPHIDNPTQTQIFTLDQEMEEILHDKGKNVDEKVKLVMFLIMFKILFVD